jgi:hypothetical protein
MYETLRFIYDRAFWGHVIDRMCSPTRMRVDHFFMQPSRPPHSRETERVVIHRQRGHVHINRVPISGFSDGHRPDYILPFSGESKYVIIRSHVVQPIFPAAIGSLRVANLAAQGNDVEESPSKVVWGWPGVSASPIGARRTTRNRRGHHWANAVSAIFG